MDYKKIKNLFFISKFSTECVNGILFPKTDILRPQIDSVVTNLFTFIEKNGLKTLKGELKENLKTLLRIILFRSSLLDFPCHKTCIKHAFRKKIKPFFTNISPKRTPQGTPNGPR